uniref:Glycine-rich protein n=1 Tax=Plectus sambesii TaxID=2011161 RepID=A0A914VR09_9BILA
MAYIDSAGNVVEGNKPGLFDWFWGLIAFITLFFKTLVNPGASKKGARYESSDPRDRFRNGGGGGGGRWPGSGGPGGPGRDGGGGGGGQRRIGRLNQGSGASCPPMAGGG